MFITPDRNVPHQQNLASFDIAVIVLACGPNRMAAYEPRAEALRNAVSAAARGEALVFSG